MRLLLLLIVAIIGASIGYAMDEYVLGITMSRPLIVHNIIWLLMGVAMAAVVSRT